jgi:hypothetical protein
VVDCQVDQAEQEKARLSAAIKDLNERAARQREQAANLVAIQAYSQRVATNLEQLDFAGRQLALEALGIRVTANGRGWAIDGDIPLGAPTGKVTTTSLRSGQSTSYPFSISVSDGRLISR